VGAYRKSRAKIIEAHHAGGLRRLFQTLSETDSAPGPSFRLSFQSLYLNKEILWPVRAFHKPYPRPADVFPVELFYEFHLSSKPLLVLILFRYTWIIEKYGNIELIHQSLHYGSAARSAAAVQQKLRLIGKLLQIISEYEFFLDFKETLVTYNHNGLLYHIIKSLKM